VPLAAPGLFENFHPALKPVLEAGFIPPTIVAIIRTPSMTEWVRRRPRAAIGRSSPARRTTRGGLICDQNPPLSADGWQGAR